MYLRHEIGKKGEEIAANYLQKENYKIIERNFRSRKGEIDIIAFDNINKELVFLEIKTRTNNNYGKPSEAVTNIKQKHIYQAAKYYIYCKRIKNIPIRIDVIEINLNKNTYTINHIKQAITKESY